MDESRRNDTYYLAAAIVDPKDLTVLRKRLGGLLLPGQYELHFKKEMPSRRKEILSRLVEWQAKAVIHQASCGRDVEAARQACVARLAEDLIDVNCVRLVLDSREERDVFDMRTIRTTLGKYPRASGFIYEHMSSTRESLLWIADAVAWSHGAGGDWARRVRPVVEEVVWVDIRP
ncbi:hypothetical protein [Saccharothrix violaceirubra]|uniref:Uncharacterized protein n=1 Tax=Saccharothrix violaceirubra TaxID=413306 RepID=A0A7W7X048_9PSEU|nr:hypothetical protein [Saccharothrix violaceirubra]MBB4969528.1 hypothetical protein [Saccharothrix violaceirubra]